jgi:hypothetical protein
VRILSEIEEQAQRQMRPEITERRQLNLPELTQQADEGNLIGSFLREQNPRQQATEGGT